MNRFKSYLYILAFLAIGPCLWMGTMGCDSGDGGSSTNVSPTDVVVTGITPTSGPEDGGTTITISGANFTGAFVKINDVLATDVVVSSDGTSIQCVTPSNNAGTYPVVVINNAGKTGTWTAGFTYITATQPAPTLTSVDPTSGRYNQSQEITLAGTNFQTGATVYFITPAQVYKAATSVIVVNEKTITCMCPTGYAGEIDTVIVRNPDNQYASFANAYYYTSELWEATALNAPHTGKPKVWNYADRPLLLRGGHQAVWTGSGMLVWGRNVTPIPKKPAPVFRFTNPFLPITGIAGSIVTLYGEADIGEFVKDTTGSPQAYFLVDSNWVSVSTTYIGPNTLTVVAPTPAAYPRDCYIKVVNPDGQTAITRTTFRITSSRDKNQAPSDNVTSTREVSVAGAYNIGAYLTPGTNSATDKWTEISVTNAPIARCGYTTVWTGTKLIVWGGYDDRPQPEKYYNTGAVYDIETNKWTTMSTANAPKGRSGHTAIWTSDCMFVCGGHDGSEAFGDGGLYNPSTDTWTAAPEITPRCYHSAISWTGTNVIVWGGISKPYISGDTSLPEVLNTGYTFVFDSNTPYATKITTPLGTSLAGGRYRHTAVWDSSNRKMIVWGGISVLYSGTYPSDPTFMATGAYYDPLTTTWTDMAASGIAARAFHNAVYLESAKCMVVWGGVTSYDDGAAVNKQPVPEPSGGRYYAATNTWDGTAMATLPATDASGNTTLAKFGHSAVAYADTTDGISKMILWGGDDNRFGGQGFVYNPSGNSWRSVLVGVSPARGYHTSINTGSQMIVWGGGNLSTTRTRYADGAILDQTTKAWTGISYTTTSPNKRDRHSAVWDPNTSAMLIWGGGDEASVLNDGLIYYPASGTWSILPDITATLPTFSKRDRHTAVWTKDSTVRYMLVWGGATIGGTPLGNGAIYEHSSGTWRAMSSTSAPTARFSHTATWTGSQMIVWGGQQGSGEGVGTGAIYSPPTTVGAGNDSWSATSTSSNCPSARFEHTAVWTGSAMIIWGGRTKTAGDAYEVYKTGGVYNPTTNTWTATSTTGYCPAARYGHTAVWTGSKMIIWGGTNGSTIYNDGGIYDPTANSWSKISSLAAPLARSFHTAEWMPNMNSGAGAMIIFGGFYEDFLSSGAIYYQNVARWEPLGYK